MKSVENFRWSASWGNSSIRRSWYHGRQPEVFLQHDSHCACQDVLELRSRTSKREFSRLKPKVQILGSSKSIRHTKVAILRLKSCFLRKKETKLHANLWKAFSTELRCRRSWWFDVVLLNDLHLARKPRSRSSSARPAMPFVNQEHLGLVVPTLDSAIHRINLYPADSVIDFCNTYPLDNYLSGGWRYPTFEQPGPVA